MNGQWQLHTTSPEQTRELGRCLGELLQAGDMILLQGDLGVGKTHFAQGIGVGLDIGEPLTSPTFTLVAEYDGRLPLTHMDLYRLYADESDENEVLSERTLTQIAFDDYLDGERVVLIEWPTGVRSYLDDYLFVAFSYGDTEDAPNDRNIVVTAEGNGATERLREWVSAWPLS
ncbi:tRNA (adenosine(37)-N6)-threonylcarbamoyltransferase complex ATPase subunit type 1 TsaE [Alicyclobacillus dauci]|uniref:tRNA threonylcarbamoyladenosine biosynthesis protein TsaE n=1 Tax=Alicyclobacillus dauci TaxID=1475485 RepID=A0ABY6Z1P6_9BACL|nr:tRNA (adenosine(37)-N6)-threonylcarbamoyltransferase complex ATPase subunit type 1 TsaE [Alicyclobacillus dauci]WAH36670.1 tRNA (adenosine(37)-N6)-threonylcarbamoyltransferase complex ATPase subunit type 1 TsaE [Alicyclobacillus dauci]